MMAAHGGWDSNLQLEDYENIAPESSDPIAEFEDFSLKLPHELWMKIFSYLNIFELCDVSLVNTKFCKLVRDPILWTKFSIRGDAITGTDTIKTFLERSIFLKEITIQCRDDISEILESISSNCKRLQKLEVKFCPSIDYKDLERLSIACPDIKELNLECTGCQNKNASQKEVTGEDSVPLVSFATIFRNFKCLTHLYLYACKNLNSQGLKMIADSCQSMACIDIDEVTGLSDESVVYFIERNSKTLHEMRIDGESLSDITFSKLKILTSLEILSISFAENMGSEGFLSISTIKSLEFLKIRKGSSLLSSDFVSAFSNGKLGKLVYLDLSECCKLSDLGLMTISMNCHNLGTLKLCWCWELSDKSFIFVLRYCRCLINLNLCGVVRLDGEFLVDIPQKLVGLEMLDLEQCPRIEASDIKALREEKPNLTVKDYYGEVGFED